MVVTPSLNKSFKFQSEWPYNNSQIYLLQPILMDLENDKNLKFEAKNNEYILNEIKKAKKEPKGKRTNR